MNKTTKILVSVILVLAFSTITLATQYWQKIIPHTATIIPFGPCEVWADVDKTIAFDLYNWGAFDPSEQVHEKTVTTWIENIGNTESVLRWTLTDSDTWTKSEEGYNIGEDWEFTVCDRTNTETWLPEDHYITLLSGAVLEVRWTLRCSNLNAQDLDFVITITAYDVAPP